MTSIAKQERHAICHTLRKVGPSAPTLCQGWNSKDLLIHLIIRENRPDASVGIFLPIFNSYTKSVSEKYEQKSFDELISIFENGPKIPSPFAIPGVDDLVNSFEYLVHHEDLLRAQSDFQPRIFSDEDKNVLWQRFTKGAIFFMRKAKVGVVAKSDQGVHTIKTGKNVVTISGDVIDLILFAFGRKSNTKIEFEGDLDRSEEHTSELQSH